MSYPIDETVKILLVDDEPRNLDALESILESSGYTFIRAQTADQALLATLQNDFAAIILDIKMPGMDGMELAQLIKQRKRSQHVPILFLTAYSLDESEVLQAYGIGAVDFLSKPINPEILRSKVSVFASLYRTTRELTSAKELLETRVLERTEALQESDRRKDEFLATLAHELRNPLAPIRYAVKVLDLKGPGTAEQQWAVDLIERQTQHMARLIDDLLDISRITRNTLELRKESLELSAVIAAAVETVRPLIDRDGHTLNINLPSEKIYINGDPVRLAQIFSNLLHNAAKYSKTERSGGNITVTARTDGGSVAVSVKDDGVGIAEPMLPRVFEMFAQVRKSIEKSEGGLGIGLALAQRLAEMHGGRIEASSDGLGKGSKFTVHLPVVHIAPSVQQKSDIKATPDGAGRRILIADDNVDVAESFEVMLQMFGHDVRTAFDGLEALEVAEEFRPEIIVLDVGMPKLDGYETARRIRQKPWGRDVVLIAVTGWGNEKDKSQSAAAGFDVHLVKPVDADTILKSLTTLELKK